MTDKSALELIREVREAIERDATIHRRSWAIAKLAEAERDVEEMQFAMRAIGKIKADEARLRAAVEEVEREIRGLDYPDDALTPALKESFDYIADRLRKALDA